MVELALPGYSSLQSTATDASPFPFPVQPDVGGVGVTIRHELVLQRIADGAFDQSANEPAFAAPVAGPPTIVPCDLPLVSPWGDGRYVWGSRYSDDHHWVVGGRSILRLFALVDVEGDPSENNVTIDVGGKLSGYWSRNGRHEGAIHAATRRSS